MEQVLLDLQALRVRQDLLDRVVNPEQEEMLGFPVELVLLGHQGLLVNLDHQVNLDRQDHLDPQVR